MKLESMFKHFALSTSLQYNFLKSLQVKIPDILTYFGKVTANALVSVGRD